MEESEILYYVEKTEDKNKKRSIEWRIKTDIFFCDLLESSLNKLKSADWPLEVASHFFQIDSTAESGCRRQTPLVASIFGYERIDNPDTKDGRFRIGNKKITLYRRVKFFK